ncbi:unnamed protein product [Bursaphelenchus xylophilus]|uniref:(pine wood nematode) hypothetical protein n=1 Tax=Bursaphelenchus xylophilus TaxID=6326 RepID=A0A7I8XIZ4_BURXY|nr:unnamed protein product [Bursaphelenchus xylophilus]CAG9125425.1 unnamed protein product [Bursaphelenchus xylophilus]
MIVTLCINDLIFTLFVSIGLQQVEYVDGYAILFTYTPLRHLGINAMHTICFFHLVVLTLASTTILLIFHFRYQMVCNHHIMSPFEIYRFMFLATLWAVWDSSLALYAGHTTKAENPGIELTLFANHPDWWENGLPLDLPIIHRVIVGAQSRS